MTSLRIRQAVRALVVTPQHETLLVRFEFPTRHVWAMPGGGLEPGEDHITALRRELVEEVGLHDVEIGPHIWTREHIIPFVDGRWDGQRDEIYLVRTDRFDPEPTLSWDQLRAERLHEIRWWTRVEVNDAANDAAAVGFAPAMLPQLFTSLIDIGPPTHPIDTGV